MPSATLVPVEEYLRTSYRPDCDYIDGEVIERNLGEYEHGRTQSNISFWLRGREKNWKVRAVVEVRLRITASRFRIPDLMLIDASAPREPVVTTPPKLCIEILSPCDTLNSTWERTKDYFSISVPFCWIIDPAARRGWIATPAGLVEAEDGIMRANEIEMPLAEVFDE